MFYFTYLSNTRTESCTYLTSCGHFGRRWELKKWERGVEKETDCKSGEWGGENFQRPWGLNTPRKKMVMQTSWAGPFLFLLQLICSWIKLNKSSHNTQSLVVSNKLTTKGISKQMLACILYSGTIVLQLQLQFKYDICNNLPTFNHPPHEDYHTVVTCKIWCFFIISVHEL